MSIATTLEQELVAARNRLRRLVHEVAIAELEDQAGPAHYLRLDDAAARLAAARIEYSQAFRDHTGHAPEPLEPVPDIHLSGCPARNFPPGACTCAGHFSSSC